MRDRVGRALAGLVLAGLMAACVGSGDEAVAPDPPPTAEPAALEPSPSSSPSTAPSPVPSPSPTPVVADVGAPFGTAVRGLLTFRGNPTRTFYGAGPVPQAPEVAWRYPEGGSLCGESTVGSDTTTWCGTGWTGQPSVFERDGRTWLVVGAYDHRVHFLDARTGQPIIPPFRTGDIIKGSVSVDPDGYPLVYTGSRDNRFRVSPSTVPNPSSCGPSMPPTPRRRCGTTTGTGRRSSWTTCCSSAGRTAASTSSS